MDFLTVLLYGIGVLAIYDVVRLTILTAIRFVVLKRHIKKLKASQTENQPRELAELLKKIQDSQQSEDESWH